MKYSEEIEERFLIPKLNSCLFTEELHEYDNNILCDKNRLKEFAIGWCYGEELSFRPKKDMIAIMIEENITDDFSCWFQYWIHCDKDSFEGLFLKIKKEKI